MKRRPARRWSQSTSFDRFDLCGVLGGVGPGFCSGSSTAISRISASLRQKGKVTIGFCIQYDDPSPSRIARRGLIRSIRRGRAGFSRLGSVNASRARGEEAGFISMVVAIMSTEFG